MAAVAWFDLVCVSNQMALILYQREHCKQAKEKTTLQSTLIVTSFSQQKAIVKSLFNQTKTFT